VEIFEQHHRKKNEKMNGRSDRIRTFSTHQNHKQLEIQTQKKLTNPGSPCIIRPDLSESDPNLPHCSRHKTCHHQSRGECAMRATSSLAGDVSRQAVANDQTEGVVAEPRPHPTLVKCEDIKSSLPCLSEVRIDYKRPEFVAKAFSTWLQA
jgi:hypothetical protein